MTVALGAIPGRPETSSAGREGAVATVLYVDDEVSIQRAVRAWLSRRGHQVHTAANLGEARQLLEQHPIDGVFLDVWLGTESGFELQAWIDDNQPELTRRIVYVTGDIMAEPSVARTMDQLGRPVLPKPFELRDLETYIAHWIAGPGLSAQVEASPA